MGRMGEVRRGDGGLIRIRGECLEDLLGFSTLDALCADVCFSRFAVDLDPYLLQIGQPASLRYVVSVADVITGSRFLSTYGAFFTHIYPPKYSKE